MIKEYRAYLKDNPQGYWFKAKLYGWGWTPARWQGWIVLLVFVALLFGNFYRIEAQHLSEEASVARFSAETVVLVVILLTICWKTGEKPRWQWGVPISSLQDNRTQFEIILPKICSAETAQSRSEWDQTNPLKGHCAVVSLLAQDIFGGDILRASLEGTGFSGSHYWNRFPGGEEVDFTKNQFGDNLPILVGELRERSFLLSSEDTRSRYEILVKKYKNELKNQDKY